MNESEVRGFGCTSKTQPITYRNLGLRLVRRLSGRTTPRVCLTPTGEGVIQPHFLHHPSAVISNCPVGSTPTYQPHGRILVSLHDVRVPDQGQTLNGRQFCIIPRIRGLTETGFTRKDISPRETRPGIIIHHTGGGVRFVYNACQRT